MYAFNHTNKSKDSDLDQLLGSAKNYWSILNITW